LRGFAKRDAGAGEDTRYWVPDNDIPGSALRFGPASPKGYAGGGPPALFFHPLPPLPLRGKLRGQSVVACDK